MGTGTFLSDQVKQGVFEAVSKALELIKGNPDCEVAAPFVVQLNVLVFTEPMLIHQEFVVGDTITVSHVNNSIVNIKGSLHAASITIDSAPVDGSKKENLKALIGELEACLTKEAPNNPESTEAISDSAKNTMDKVSKSKPNKRSIETSTKSLLGVAEDVAEAVPVVTKIASVIGGMSGFTV